MISNIYVLLDPRDNTVGYIGKTTNPSKRYSGHIYPNARENNNKGRWVESLLSLGIKPEMVILESGEVGDDDERFYIAYLKSLGAVLTNSTDGGDVSPLRGECLKKSLATKRRNGGWSKQVGYKGVSIAYRGKSESSDRFSAVAKLDKPVYLGCFKDPSDAAKAYDKAMYEYWGHDAYFNFPELLPNDSETHNEERN